MKKNKFRILWETGEVSLPLKKKEAKKGIRNELNLKKFGYKPIKGLIVNEKEFQRIKKAKWGLE